MNAKKKENTQVKGGLLPKLKKKKKFCNEKYYKKEKKNEGKFLVRHAIDWYQSWFEKLKRRIFNPIWKCFCDSKTGNFCWIKKKRKKKSKLLHAIIESPSLPPSLPLFLQLPFKENLFPFFFVNNQRGMAWSAKPHFVFSRRD